MVDSGCKLYELPAPGAPGSPVPLMDGNLLRGEVGREEFGDRARDLLGRFHHHGMPRALDDAQARPGHPVAKILGRLRRRHAILASADEEGCCRDLADARRYAHAETRSAASWTGSRRAA